MLAIDPIADGRLADANALGEFFLGGLGMTQVIAESFHFGDFIAKTYIASIADSYALESQNPAMTHAPDSGIIRRLKEAAQRAGKPATQAGIAAMLGISQPSVAEWNRGGMPTIERTVRAAELSGLCVEWIYTGRGPKTPGNEIPADDQVRELLKVWDKLAPDARGSLLSTAKFMRTVQITADPERVKEVHRELQQANQRFRARSTRN